MTLYFKYHSQAFHLGPYAVMETNPLDLNLPKGSWKCGRRIQLQMALSSSIAKRVFSLLSGGFGCLRLWTGVTFVPREMPSFQHKKQVHRIENRVFCEKMRAPPTRKIFLLSLECPNTSLSSEDPPQTSASRGRKGGRTLTPRKAAQQRVVREGALWEPCCIAWTLQEGPWAVQAAAAAMSPATKQTQVTWLSGLGRGAFSCSRHGTGHPRFVYRVGNIPAVQTGSVHREGSIGTMAWTLQGFLGGFQP